MLYMKIAAVSNIKEPSFCHPIPIMDKFIYTFLKCFEVKRGLIKFIPFGKSVPIVVRFKFLCK